MSRKKAPQRPAGSEVIPEGRRDSADGDPVDCEAAELLATKLVVQSFLPNTAMAIARNRKRFPAYILDAIKRTDCAAISAFIVCHFPQWQEPEDDLLRCMLEHVKEAVEGEDERSMRGAEHRIKTGETNRAAVEAMSSQYVQAGRVRKGQAVLDIAARLEIDESTVRKHRRALTANQKLPKR